MGMREILVPHFCQWSILYSFSVKKNGNWRLWVGILDCKFCHLQSWYMNSFLSNEPMPALNQLINFSAADEAADRGSLLRCCIA